MSKRLTLLFPFIAISASLLAWKQPQLLNELGHLIVPLLMTIMFSMGLTLAIADFKRVLAHKSAIAIGVALQYTVMPLAAYIIAKAFELPNDLLIGMLLVGSASGGTASNVICFLAKANVALSISMTLISTLIGVFALPTLSWLYLGEIVSVPAINMFFSVSKIVILPLATGLVLNHFFHRQVTRLTPLLPLITSGAIVFVIAIIVSLNQPKLASISIALVLAVVLHNTMGLIFGYFGSRFFGQSDTTSRTISIEVGMQNSGLAVALALKYFSPLAALPGALFSIWHNITGATLAAFWAERATRD